MKSTVIALAAAASLAAGAAQSLTVSVTDQASSSGMTLSPSAGSSANEVTFTFDWDSVPSGGVWGWFEFEVTGSQNALSFDSYTIDGGGTVASDQTGFVFYRTDSSFTFTQGGGTPGGGPSEIVGFDRILIGATGNTNGSVTTPTDPLYETATSSDFGAGTYVIGLYDSATPTDAAVEMTVSSVPLPASALLLGGLFGGLAWRARRKAA
mgnify:CR=1 FL=1